MTFVEALGQHGIGKRHVESTSITFY